MGRILTVEQAAKKLQVKPNTVRAWLRSGKIPGRKIGRVYRVPEEGLDVVGSPASSRWTSWDFMREKQLDTAREGWRKLSRAERERRLNAAMGILAEMPFSSQDFLREKREEIEREEGSRA